MREHQAPRAELISHRGNLLGPRATGLARPYPQGPMRTLLMLSPTHAQGPWAPHCQQDCWAQGPQG